MQIRFAVAGGRGVGLGHVMRCAAIAAEAEARGHSVRFVLRGDAAAALALGAELQDVELEPWTTPMQTASAGDWLVVDAPGDVRGELLAARAAGARTCVIDRLDQLDAADATVLPVAHGPRLTHPRLFQGPEWCIIAPVVRTCADRPYPGHRCIGLITLGAADPLGLTEQIARVVRDAVASSVESPWLELQVVVGPAFADPETTARSLEALGCRLRRGPDRAELASLMGRTLFAVSAFGTSVYDLAAVGVPVVYWTHRASDLEPAHRLEAAGLGAVGGDGTRFAADACRDLLRRTVLDPTWRARASMRGRALVANANGAARIVDLMEIGMLEASA